MTALEMFVQAAEKFIAKVESGKAHSIVTYNDLKKALEQYKAEQRLGQ